ncbi:MAG TPA: molybdopterin-binding protein [Verrucomicrobiae bacterium]|nr:molybdopterin-binding protein [Verrucomicrobiae bacterium]
MKKVRTDDAVGSILCQDITRIVPGEFKGAAFKKGHIITPEDVPELLKLGKDHLFVWENKPGFIHENEAAERLAKAVGGKNVSLTMPSEGKINLLAEASGLLKVDRAVLNRVNGCEQVVLATRHNNILVKRGEVLAGTRVVPLVIEEQKIKVVEDICAENPVLEVKPLGQFKVGVINTGNEVFYGRIKDSFGPVLRQKFAELGSNVVKQVFAPDDQTIITATIHEFIQAGIEFIAISGGMSVDPDDLTPGAIKASGAEVVGYGAPVLPGSMVMVAYLGKVPVVGLPGCVMYAKSTVFDLIVPRLLAGEKVTKQDLTDLGYGGLCLQCPECNYPVCPFGKA